MASSLLEEHENLGCSAMVEASHLLISNFLLILPMEPEAGSDLFL
jgi:hypothetical protein